MTRQGLRVTAPPLTVVEAAARRFQATRLMDLGLLIALLALLIDWVGRVVEHVARPKGLSPA